MTDEIEWLDRWAADTDPERNPISPTEIRSAPPITVGAVASTDRSARGPKLLVAAVVVVLVGVTAMAVHARDGDDTGTVRTGAASTSTTGADTASSAVSTASTTLPATTGSTTEPGALAKGWVGIGLLAAPIYQEGFDYGVRILRDDVVIAERVLADFSNDGGQPRTYWTSFEVAPGTLVVASDLNVGAGPPPAPPDYTDACSSTIDVPDSGGVLLQLNWDSGCLDPLPASELPALSSAPTTLTQASPGPTGIEPAPTSPNGSFDGVEEFTAFTGRCPFLDHKLDATYALSDGAKWAFHSTYCGEVDSNNRHYGDGEFFFTTADGSTLSGTFHSEAQVPSTGVPYTLQIHEGTGLYAGATGACSLDNHLEPIRFGRQRQYGTFSCTLTLDAAGGK